MMQRNKETRLEKDKKLQKSFGSSKKRPTFATAIEKPTIECGILRK